MALLLGLAAVSLAAPAAPLSEVLAGKWMVSVVHINSGVVEDAPTENFSLAIEASNASTVWMGDLVPMSEDGSLQHLALESEEGTNFTFAINESQVFASEFVPTDDGVRYCHGALSDPNLTFSFVILSSYRVELTLFNRSSNAVVLYRGLREFESPKLSNFGDLVAFFVRRTLFRSL